MNYANMEKNLVNLKILSRVQVGDKLSMRDEDFISIDRPTFWQGIRRWFTNNSRTKTIDHVKSVINNTLDITNSALKLHQSKAFRNEKQLVVNPILPRYLSYMNDANKGLGSLARSYENDVTTFQVLNGYITKFSDQCHTIECVLSNHNHAATYSCRERIYLGDSGDDIPLAEEVKEGEEEEERSSLE